MTLRSGAKCRCRWLVIAAVFCLTVNVATRYCFVTVSDTRVVRKEMGHSPNGERQRLLGDGLHWVAPAASFGVLHPRPARRIASRNTPAIADLFPEDCLYNRPPPAC